MNLKLCLPAFLLFMASAIAVNIEFRADSHRIYWDSVSDYTYVVERSTNLIDWNAISPVRVGDGSSQNVDASLPTEDNVFYRLLKIPPTAIQSPVVDDSSPEYLSWIEESSDGSLRFEFYALLDSTNFADVHYRVNGDSWLNLRMDGDLPRLHYQTPALSEGDEVDFYFTFDDGGPVEDTPTRTYTVGAGGSGSDPVDPPTGSEYEDVLFTPRTPSDYSHGLTFANGQVDIRLKTGVDPEEIIVTYSINEGSTPAGKMTKSGDEWSYQISASEGDTLEYWFESRTPGHIRSPRFERVIGSAQPADIEPDVIIAAGRFRDRHENELRFDPYVDNYFDRSYFGLVLLDYGNSIDVTFDPAEPMNFVDIKLFDQLTTPHEERGIDVRADYDEAHRMFEVDDKFYWRVEPLDLGQFVDMEFTLQRTRTGQQYYTAIFRMFQGAGGLTQRVTDQEAYSGGMTTVDVYSELQYGFSQAAHNISPDNLRDFLAGKRIFDQEFTSGDGLGPLYNATSCFSCHVNDGSAAPPGSFSEMMQGMLVKLAEPTVSGQIPHPEYGVQLQDRAIEGEHAEGRGHVTYNEIAGQFDDGTSYSLADPQYSYSGLRGPGFLTAIHSPRVAPKLIGMGLLEAIPETTLNAWADPTDANLDGISGRVNQVPNPESGLTEAGRFGWKASQSSTRNQVAIALREDMGISNVVYPESDDSTELTETDFEAAVHYTQLLGPPLRRNWDDSDVLAGEQLFTTLDCVSCHKPSVTTGNDHPIAELRNQLIHPYTDLLLHDMGDGLADEVSEGDAEGREWRTAPLWGIGRTEEVSGHTRFLHDGRARNLEEAILWHGGEAEASRDAYKGLTADERAQLLKFLESL
ncbi:MAG: di-heme oxidoredictase family protein [Verrucomicrobiota bacterium]